MASKDPVKLRERATKDGGASLYLEIYQHGKRTYEYLHLYLVPENTRADKERNRQIRLMAETIRSKALIDFMNGKYDIGKQSLKNTYLLPFARQLIKDKGIRFATQHVWKNALYMIELYKGPNITFADIDANWVVGFKKFLASSICRFIKYKKKPLSQNTQFLYYSKFKCILNEAVRRGVIDKSPAANVTNLQGAETERMYLTIEELRKLTQTPCSSELVRKTFLFSCLTGLRKSDVLNLKWGNVKEQGGFLRLFYKQRKTEHIEYLDLSPQAIELMGERRGDDQLVFPRIYDVPDVNAPLARWVKDAGIDKHISFHCARHTFAVMQLDLGTDIYTVSKLLGHRNINTTQVYAKVLDKNKQAAMLKIPSIF